MSDTYDGTAQKFSSAFPYYSRNHASVTFHDYYPCSADLSATDNYKVAIDVCEANQETKAGNTLKKHSHIHGDVVNAIFALIIFRVNDVFA